MRLPTLPPAPPLAQLPDLTTLGSQGLFGGFCYTPTGSVQNPRNYPLFRLGMACNGFFPCHYQTLPLRAVFALRCLAVVLASTPAARAQGGRGTRAAQPGCWLPLAWRFHRSCQLPIRPDMSPSDVKKPSGGGPGGAAVWFV